MTRLLTDGAEMGDILRIPYSYPSGYVSASTTQKRSGNYSYYIANAVAIYFVFQSSSEIYIRMGIFVQNYYDNAAYYLCAWNYDLSTNLGHVRLNSYGNLILRIGTVDVVTGTKTVTLNSWNLLEVHIKIDDANGLVETKLNGIADITYTGDTKPSTQTTVSYIVTRSNSTSYIDDIAINDTSGAVDNSWCGDGHVIALVPNANGDLSQLTGSDGNSTDNYLLVDETPSNSDTDYVEGSTVDQKDLYNLTASGLSNVNISRVWGESRSKDTTTAGGLLAITLKTEGVEYDSSDIALPTVYTAVKGPEYLVNPQTGVAWTVAELDALQVGPKTRS